MPANIDGTGDTLNTLQMCLPLLYYTESLGGGISESYTTHHCITSIGLGKNERVGIARIRENSMRLAFEVEADLSRHLTRFNYEMRC